MKMRKT